MALEHALGTKSLPYTQPESQKFSTIWQGKTKSSSE